MRGQSPDFPRGDVWAVNTLDRATRMGQNVYERALSRKIEWPKPLSEQQKCSPHFEDPMVYTSIDDAFSTVLQCMSQTTRQCKDKKLARNYEMCSHPVDMKEIRIISAKPVNTVFTGKEDKRVDYPEILFLLHLYYATTLGKK
ncbi:hypothetical protein ACJMK2_028910 [Sinanodonta woodiana]|uniref:Uncharacterized protein n=1 Tax=Sinanodonta woodiana TaxID=1069815 RepID=A0ABD3XCE1_SINWO